jgi:hypothetical protein
LSWIVVIIGVVAVLAIVILIGVVRNVIRRVLALAAGLLIPALVYWGASAFGLAENIPMAGYFALGVLSALSVLFKR